jgi:H+/Cl- antiporter ClcA
MNFYIHLYYYLTCFSKYKKLSDKRIHAFILLGAIFVFHLFTIIGFVSAVINYNPLNSFLISDELFNRFVIIPLIISPVYLSLWVIYKFKCDYINNKINEIKTLEIVKRKKMNFMLGCYITVTVILTIIAGMSKFIN